MYSIVCFEAYEDFVLFIRQKIRFSPYVNNRQSGVFIKMIRTKELSYEQRLEIVFYHNNGKSYRQISDMIGCSKSAAFGVCKKFEKTRSVKNLPRSGRPRTR